MRQEETSGGNRLLHNMSIPPKTTIGFSSSRFVDRSARVRFLLPADFPKTRPSAMLRALGDERARIPKEIAERDLYEMIEERARRLNIPFVASVIDQALPGDTVCTDPLTVITVLSKSSNHVFIRDKSPNLYAIRGDRSVVLILPGKGKLI